MDSLKLCYLLVSKMEFIFKHRPPKDVFYDFETEDKDRKVEENKKKMKTSRTYTKRVIVHPSFHNSSYKEVIALMEHMDQGECVIRPSSKVSKIRVLR